MAYDFQNDPNCVALWRFEPGAILTDSKGTNNFFDWEDPRVPAADTSDFKEGTSSSVWVAGDPLWTGLQLGDGDLNEGFPFKWTDANPGLTISLTFWIKPSQLTADTFHFIYCKYDDLNDSRSFATTVYGSELTLLFGFGAVGETISTGITLSTDQWYHIGVTAGGIDKTWSARVYNAGNGNVSQESGTFTVTVGADWTPVNLGEDFSLASRGFYGKLDEIAVFKDLLSSTDIDNIRDETYTPGSSQGSTSCKLGLGLSL